MAIAGAVSVALLALAVLFLLVLRVRAHVGLKKAGADWEESQRELKKSIDGLSDVFKNVERESSVMVSRLGNRASARAIRRATTGGVTSCRRCLWEKRRNRFATHIDALVQAGYSKAGTTVHLQGEFSIKGSSRERLARTGGYRLEDMSQDVGGSSYDDLLAVGVSDWGNAEDIGYPFTDVHSEQQYQVAA